MGAGFFYSYHLGWSRPDVRTLLGDLEAEGLRPAHPVTGRAVLVSLDSASPGSRSPVTREQLLDVAGLRRLPEIGFRLWSDAGPTSWYASGGPGPESSPSTSPWASCPARSGNTR